MSIFLLLCVLVLCFTALAVCVFYGLFKTKARVKAEISIPIREGEEEEAQKWQNRLLKEHPRPDNRSSSLTRRRTTGAVIVEG